MILKIHGCSGAGKTTAARTLLSHAASVQTSHTPTGRPSVYRMEIPDFDRPVFLLGDYSANCGGVDTVDDYREVLRLLDKFAPHGHVVFEGLLQSTYYGKMGEHSLQYGGDYIYAFLDTPLQTCLGRVAERRREKGTTSKWDPSITQEKYYNVWRLHAKLRDTTKHNVTILDTDLPMFPQLKGLLVCSPLSS